MSELKIKSEEFDAFLVNTTELPIYEPWAVVHTVSKGDIALLRDIAAGASVAAAASHGNIAYKKARERVTRALASLEVASKLWSEFSDLSLREF